MNVAGVDFYDWVKKAAKGFRKQKEEEISEDPAAYSDWSKRKSLYEFFKWIVIFPTIMIGIQLPQIFLRPVLWNTIEVILYAYIAIINIFSCVSIFTFEQILPGGKTTIRGENSNRRKATKQLMTYGAIVISTIMCVYSLQERSIHLKIAKAYCLLDLPSPMDRWIASLNSGLSVHKIDDRQLRERMRDPVTKRYMTSGACKE